MTRHFCTTPDAHPTEFVFDKLATEISDYLDLENDLRPVGLGEKGAVPFLPVDRRRAWHRRMRDAHLPEQSGSHLRRVFRSDTATNTTKSVPTNLFGYVAGNVTKVVVTNHKTGTLLMQAVVLVEYCQRGSVCVFSNSTTT